MDRIRIRAYDVRFGDAVLVTFPEQEGSRKVTRSVLVDVGNALGGKGGDDTVFAPVVEDVLEELGGAPVDLYVMTHEHLDHVQGIRYVAETVPALAGKLRFRHAWFTASADPHYYETHPDAEKKKKRSKEMLLEISRFVSAREHALPTPLRSVLAVNDLQDTQRCVDHLVSLADPPRWVHRGATPPAPFAAKLTLWAPEEDTADYYGRFQPMALHAAGGSATEGGGAAEPARPPPGVDAGAFHGLVEARRRGLADNLFEIDRAANDTSVVFLLEWRGVRILFAGDAEQRSWRHMAKAGVLEPVDVLKVSHHGSHTGTPPDAILDRILPEGAADRRWAIISQCADTYPGIPHAETERRLAARARVLKTNGKGAKTDGKVRYVELKLDART